MAFDDGVNVEIVVAFAFAFKACVLIFLYPHSESIAGHELEFVRSFDKLACFFEQLDGFQLRFVKIDMCFDGHNSPAQPIRNGR